MRLKFLAAAAALLAVPSAAQPAAAPKLLVVISVDQFSANLFDEYRPQWSGGFARLAGGTVFRNGYQSHAATETCPGHSTLLTGDRPARTGIISNIWIDQKVGAEGFAVPIPALVGIVPAHHHGRAVLARHGNVATAGPMLLHQLAECRHQ